MSKISRKGREKQFKTVGNHQEFLHRITKTLYYGKLPPTERLSLPVTELATELFSEAQTGRSLERLHCNDASKISRNACVSPCSLVLAVLYLEQLKTCNPEYLQRIAPSELFLVSLMVSSKFLHDDGEEDEVFMDEWAKSGGISVEDLIQIEKEFLQAMHWELFVHQHTFWKKLSEIETSLAKKEGVGRGWFTYTELETLLKTVDVSNLIHCVTSVIAVLMVTYTLGILTLLGSMFIVSNIPGNCLQRKTLQIENNVYLPVKHTSLERFNNTHDVLFNLQDVENDISANSTMHKKHLDAADVFKTGILLASLKSMPNPRRNSSRAQFEPSTNNSDESKNSEYTPWAWWTSPTMEWLTRTSKLIERLDFLPNFKFFIYEPYTSFANYKMINLEDQIHKATKVRIQEQMERSWHMEWTDTLKNMILRQKLLAYYF